jgi:fructose-1,6-bisphosphatase/inositol monophosphatase family enzyme
MCTSACTATTIAALLKCFACHTRRLSLFSHRLRLLQAFHRVRDAVRIPMYGCDCYAYGLLAAGHCDLVVEADLKPYDYMALVPIIQVRLRHCGSCWFSEWCSLASL